MNINKDNIKPPYAYITKPLLEAVISELPVFISMVPSGRESFFQSKVDQKVIVSVMKSQHYGNNVETITLTLFSNTPVGNTLLSVTTCLPFSSRINVLTMLIKSPAFF